MQNAYAIIMLLNIFLAVTVIFLERRNASTTWAWLMVLFFIPVIGFVMYLILGQKVRKRKLYKLLGDSQRIIEHTIERQMRQMREGEIFFNDKTMQNYQDMIYMNLITSYAIFTSNNAVEIYTEGNQKFDAL